MKFVLVLFVVAYTADMVAASPPHPCQCFNDWQAVQESPGNWYCKSPKTTSTFQCNVDEPPVCICQQNGQSVTQPLGVLNCGGDGSAKYDSLDCQKSDNWDKWLDKYPQYRLHH